MRVQDLHTIEEVHIQYFVSIEMSRQNNNRLGRAVVRTLTLSTNVITVGLAIQSALIRQKTVMEATKRTRKFLGTLIVANASQIKLTRRDRRPLHQPCYRYGQSCQAHNDLIEAMDATDRLGREED